MTVDPDLVAAGHEAVRTGLAGSLSGWVNDALAAKAVHDRRMRALSVAIADYEAAFGEITAAEIAAQRRADAETSVVVRGPRAVSRPAAKEPRRK